MNNEYVTMQASYNELFLGSRGRYRVKTLNSAYDLTLSGDANITVCGGILPGPSYAVMNQMGDQKSATVEVGACMVLTNVTCTGIGNVLRTSRVTSIIRLD